MTDFKKGPAMKNLKNEEKRILDSKFDRKRGVGVLKLVLRKFALQLYSNNINGDTSI